MKRLLLLALCALMLLPLGCGKSDPAITPDGTASPALNTEMAPTAAATEEPSGKGYCFDYRYNAIGSFGMDTYILETEDTVYYLCNNVLYFSDKDYKEFMPLCPRPDCDHKSHDCDAYIDPIGGFWIYDKYIYYASYGLNGRDPNEVRVKSASLWRLRLDGTQHEEVLKFEPLDVGFSPQRTNWQFSFRSNCVEVTYSAYRDASRVDHSTAWGTVYLDDIKLPEYDRIEKAMTASDVGSLLGPWLHEDNGLVYMLNTAADINDVSKLNYRLTSQDTDTGECEVLADLTDMPDYLDGAFMVYDGAFYYISVNDGINRLHKVDPRPGAGADEVIAEGEYKDLKIAYFDWRYGTLIARYKDPEGDPAESGFFAYDTDLNLLGHFTYDGLPEELMDLSIFLQTENYLFASDGSQGISCASVIPTWYIDKSEIGTGDLAWHRWAPEG